ncbi:multiubiquitin domain-containing protein [Elizabethkingia anophelis]|uniref:multiubiquitin domain-containing protein n=1 Tax=Elizabethkingia anophelis TaxID=1117645 RepID=UPI000C9CE2D7|nr:multiubiquitin domain-containing protein [Elizabethkingia anophelis]MCT3759786.1 multiubiquitin domain-containing protein [Elizabethkingia anophelis]MCT3974303.1 multiubiquitin domain-containing protein [Elizabethkingia anophelis]MCT4198415.1 multiubiquitin domain-containing protein [Elizabethkingia anophelis]MCT4226343.1 multiubiquitin domain-containing protein [Elizabethkingia anophelis]MCT4307935.1 multiubiquitin domain-containing protein [Elizabethkingia anophelis]
MKLDNHQGESHSQKPNVPLKFVIEGKEYETFDQYKTGAELKQLAGIPLDTELFLSISKPYQDELIENEKQVNLARPETEYFFVKKKLQFFINGKLFTWYKQYIRGIQIRQLGNIPIDDDIFLDIKEGWQDDQILDDEVVDLARPGKEKFFSKPRPIEVTIIVNARPHLWKERDISFEQLVVLAFGSYDSNPNKGYTVTYSRGWEPKPEGTMVKGSVVRVKNKMIFDVTATDKS